MVRLATEVRAKETIETSKVTYQGGGYKTSIPKKIVESLELDSGDTLVWVKTGKVVKVSPIRNVLNMDKFSDASATDI